MSGKAARILLSEKQHEILQISNWIHSLMDLVMRSCMEDLLKRFTDDGLFTELATSLNSDSAIQHHPFKRIHFQLLKRIIHLWTRMIP